MIAPWLLLLSCAPPGPVGPPPDLDTGIDLQARPYDRICADGTVIPGIDVSYWQGSIDWSRVADDGVKFAFIRVSYGMQVYDTEYTDNWAGARDEGIVRGTYQYFLGADDATEQAQLLLDEMGPLEDGDLPPVIDVESYGNDGVSQATMRAGISTWMDVVEAEIGRPPLVYTSVGEWSAMTGDWDPGDVPLWVANWEVDCPYVPDAWDDWIFWQDSDSGSVGGISGAVDTDWFNGTLDDLHEWAGSTSPGDDTCTKNCTVTASGTTVVEEDGACGCPTGETADLEDADGHDGHAWWTAADVAEPDYSEGINWMLDFEAAGSYDVYAWIPDVSQLTSGARYKVFHGTDATYAVIDQASAAGDWTLLGTWDFAAGADQWVRLGDNYADASDAGAAVAIDALRVEPAGTGDSGDAGDTGDTGDSGDAGDAGGACACAEEGQERIMSCSDGGSRFKTCDGCDWGQWSQCEGGEAPGGCGCASTDGPGGRRSQGEASSHASKGAGAGSLLVLLALVVWRRPGWRSSCPQRP